MKLFALLIMIVPLTACQRSTEVGAEDKQIIRALAYDATCAPVFADRNVAIGMIADKAAEYEPGAVSQVFEDAAGEYQDCSRDQSPLNPKPATEVK